tara:strand:- start:397 stop:645 length:249 start_codon:yes stop_codon:yes gene_type:complete
MNYYVYLIKSFKKGILKTYVGYTNNLERRIKLHNEGKGAKSTRGRVWYLAYAKKFNSKSDAIKGEYKLKKNRKLRNFIKDNI